MLNLIRRWWYARQRLIFPYWDGLQQRAGDPLAIWRSFHDDPEFSLVKHPGLIDLGDLDAMRIAVAAVRRALAIPNFDDGGLTEQECLLLLIDFLDYVAALKKNTDLPLNSPSPTAAASSPAPPPIPSTTNPTVASFSTAPTVNPDTVTA